MASRLRLAVGAATLALAAGVAAAHDSWLSPAREGRAAGQVALELATGVRFPVQEFTQTPASVAGAQCTGGAGKPWPLQPRRQQAQWLELAAGEQASRPALACWAELHAAEIELPPATVRIYLAEIRASDAVRAAWQRAQARGEPWRETYRKFARIELAAAGPAVPGRLAQARQPAGMDLEIVVLGDQPIAVGQPLEFLVLRDGQPLAGLPVELVSERSPLGIWQLTDARGRLRHSLPFGGRWLLRATDLQPPDEMSEGRWHSRFVTLAIDAR